MTDASLNQHVSAELLAEAGVWIARLHGEGRSRAMEAGFRRWLASDTEHARAFELATEAWEDSIHLRRLIPLPHAAPHTPRRLWLAAAGIGAVLAGLGAAFFALRPAGVVTEVGEQRLLTLEDGTRVYLNTATHIVVRYDKRVRLIELRAGEALFNVAPQRDRPFIVGAAGREVRALGTAFVVRRDAQKLAVTLVEGKVSVSQSSAAGAGASVGDQGSAASPRSAQDPSRAPRPEPIVTLRPGQRIVFDSQSATPTYGETSLTQAVAWRSGQVVLEDTALDAAVAEMNRYSRVPILVEDAQARQLLINGLFQAGDSMSFASAVAHSYGLSMVEEHGRIVLRGAPTQNAPPAQPH